MKTGQIFSGTVAFCWIKLGLGLLDVLIGAVLFAIMMGIAAMTGSGEIGAILFFIWIGVWGSIHWVIKHYLGYMVKAGHVAVIAQSFKDGAIPANPVVFGKDRVKDRFATSNVYFVVDKLVAGAVKQLQKILGKVTGLLGNMPGGGVIQTIGNMFIDISLGYIDECCLGYSFYHSEQNVYKSSADGVVVYAQNWKQLLKDGAKTTFIVLLTILVVTILSFALIGGLFKLLGWSMFVAAIFSIFVSISVKYAFVDSWILVKMMSSYFTAANNTVITYDLYAKLSNLSNKFKELFRKGAETDPSPAQEINSIPKRAGHTPPENKAYFCSSCGTQHTEVLNFCPACGGKF